MFKFNNVSQCSSFVFTFAQFDIVAKSSKRFTFFLLIYFTFPFFSNVELPYFWQCYRPIPVNPRPEVDDQSEDTTNQLNIADRQLDGSMVFHINPDRGTLAPGGKTKATVCFAPPAVRILCVTLGRKPLGICLPKRKTQAKKRFGCKGGILDQCKQLV